MVAEVREADDVVARLAVLDEHDVGDDLGISNIIT